MISLWQINFLDLLFCPYCISKSRTPWNRNQRNWQKKEETADWFYWIWKLKLSTKREPIWKWSIFHVCTDYTVSAFLWYLDSIVCKHRKNWELERLWQRHHKSKSSMVAILVWWMPIWSGFSKIESFSCYPSNEEDRIRISTLGWWLDLRTLRVY